MRCTSHAPDEEGMLFVQYDAVLRLTYAGNSIRCFWAVHASLSKYSDTRTVQLRRVCGRSTGVPNDHNHPIRVDDSPSLARPVPLDEEVVREGLMLLDEYAIGFKIVLR